MSYVNVGAWVDGTRPKTKKALKEAMKTAPETVRFDVTAALTFHNGQSMYAGNALPLGYQLSVCGPDPYTTRKWYATVTDAGRVT